MDAQGWVAAISLLISVIALVFSTIGQRRANASAERAANAAERMADALERQAIEAEQASGTPGVAWELEHFQRDAYTLTNVGRAPAYEVKLDLGDIRISRGALEHDVITADGQVKFIASRTLGVRDGTVTVSWAAEPGSTQRSEWKRLLPPKS